MKTQVYVRPTTEMIRVQTAAQVLIGASDQFAGVGAGGTDIEDGAVTD